MKLRILGSGTCVPYLRRGSSAYLLSLPKSSLMLDCGAGATWKLEKVGANYLAVDHIFISHFHPDHTGDLIPFLFATKYPRGEKRVKPLWVWGARGLKTLFTAFEKAYGDWIHPECLNLREIAEGALSFGDFTVAAKRVVHSEGSLAYRIEAEGKSLVYSGDTDYCPSLVELAEGADLLLIECSLPDGMKARNHLTPSEVVRIAKESGVKRVVLTHLYPICDESDILPQIRRAVAAEVILAEDLMEISV
ncbi:MAG: MBL fold metallo-hydrolase [Deltaproteobacteria bacterium]